LNKKILIRLQKPGIAAPSNTFLHGQYAIREANVNNRSRKEDFDLMVKTIVNIGKQKGSKGQANVITFT
jgi:hypothetical protein